MLLEFVNAAAIALVGILFFRILRRYRSIALGYAATTIIECTLLIVAGISSLLLIPLSQ